MGVEGLTTYLREHRLVIAKTIELRNSGIEAYTSAEKRLEVVVDGWSFIYTLHHASQIPWVYGGQYDLFSAAVRRTVEAWLSMKVNLSFVFDGAFEAHKIATRLARQTNTTVHHSALFFRTSQSTRQTPRFLAETRILPPLIYAACIDTLKDLSSIFRGDIRGSSPYHDDGMKGRIDIYFADREADPFMVELAGRLHAYIAALDSDFVILNTPGYQGYMPLDELEWVVEGGLNTTVRSRTLSMVSSSNSLLSPSEISASTNASIWDDIAGQSINAADDDGFVPVVKKRNRIRKTSAKSSLLHSHGQTSILRNSHRSLIPPDPADGEITSLVITVYTPESTATSLGIATSLLPLLGAIVGNDATHSSKYNIPGASSTRPPISSVRPNATHHDFLFERKMNATQRVLYVANTLAAVLKQGERKKKANRTNRSILDIIRSMVTMMLVRPRDTTEREVDEIVNRIVEGALIYAIPPSTAPQQEGRDGLWPTPFCALHEDLEQCRLDALIPEGDDSDSDDDPQVDERSIIQTQYLRWYREGSLDPNVLDVLVTGTMWPRMFLESPDYSSASGPGEAAGFLRRWAYAVLEQGVGIFRPPLVEEDDSDMELVPEHKSAINGAQMEAHGRSPDHEEDEEDEDEDEIIDVVDEEDDGDGVDPLMALKGALQRLRGANGTDMGGNLPTIPDREEDEEEEDNSEEHVDECFVTEYVRRGARVADERILVEDLSTLLEHAERTKSGSATTSTWRKVITHPVQLEEERTRLVVLLLACGSDTETVRLLEKSWLAPVLTVRWLICFAAMKQKEKGTDNDSSPTLLKKWTRTEINAFLLAFHVTAEDDESSETSQEFDAIKEADGVIVTERSIQLMARGLSVVEALRMLVQVLGLSYKIPVKVSRFEGKIFHALCNTADSTVPAPSIDAKVWQAVEEGLVDCIGDDRVKKIKKKSAGRSDDTGKVVASAKRSMSSRGGRFSLLAELNS